MIIIVSTPLKILASYALVLTAGALLACRWRVDNKPTRSPAAESTTGF